MIREALFWVLCRMIIWGVTIWFFACLSAVFIFIGMTIFMFWKVLAIAAFILSLWALVAWLLYRPEKPDGH